MAKEFTLQSSEKITVFPELKFNNHWRIMWHSVPARDKWEQLLDEARQFCSSLQLRLVEEELRAAAVVKIDSENFEKFTKKLMKRGLGYQLIDLQDSNPPGIYNWSRLGEENEKMYLAVSREIEKALAVKKALAAENHEEAAGLLGCPECCIEKTVSSSPLLNEDGFWFTVEGSPFEVNRSDENYFYDLPASADAELLSPLKYMEIYLLPYSPCSIDCEKSREFIDKTLEIGKQISPEKMKLIRHIHRWPLRWSCLKGLVFVSTPVFDLEATSLPVYPELLVHLNGREYPKTGVEGIEFPWNTDLEQREINLEIDQ